MIFPTRLPRFLLLLPMLCSSLMAAESWDQWRGPNRDGRISGAKWPTGLDEARLKKRWQLPFGPSYSGPVMNAERVFITETVDKKREQVTALRRSDGSVVWKRDWEGAMSVPFFARSNGDWIRATPALDGDTLYVAGMRDVLVALNSTDGSERWRLDFVKRFGADLPTFGFVSSPLIDGDSVYVQAGGGVARLRKADGQVVWHGARDGGGMMGSAFGSPVILTLAGKRQLVVQARTRLFGVALEDGAELWSLPVESFRGMNILTPTFAGKDRLFTAAYGGKTLGIDIRSENGGFRAVPAWEFKAQGYMTSPIIHEGHAYLQLRSQRALCIELATGAEKWTTSESFGKYWSMVAQADRVLALDERGELILFKATPEKFDVLSRRKVAESDAWAHLAVDGSELYIRELKALSVWDWSSGASQP
ncbi:MAG: pyrrolo-quinoline quinone [Pedosphaera sp.]|nr:pyrrolo-quinoline quinone [Pedosphaera sp.]